MHLPYLDCLRQSSLADTKNQRRHLANICICVLRHPWRPPYFDYRVTEVDALLTHSRINSKNSFDVVEGLIHNLLFSLMGTKHKSRSRVDESGMRQRRTAKPEILTGDQTYGGRMHTHTLLQTACRNSTRLGIGNAINYQTANPCSDVHIDNTCIRA